MLLKYHKKCLEKKEYIIVIFLSSPHSDYNVVMFNVM